MTDFRTMKIIDENLFIFESNYIFYTLRIFRFVRRKFSKRFPEVKLYRRLRGNVFVGRARMILLRDSEIDPGGEITDRITIRDTKERDKNT